MIEHNISLGLHIIFVRAADEKRTHSGLGILSGSLIENNLNLGVDERDPTDLLVCFTFTEDLFVY